MKPITPSEARKHKDSAIPDEVIESFNELISEKINMYNTVTISQPEAVERILSKMPNISKEILFQNKWLDIEQIYRDNGWTVTYDKPAYNEPGEPCFLFKGKVDKC